MTAKQVADYFLSVVDDEAGDSLSNLKLQKLVYYAQGFHLALYDKPLFSESIEAWQHGPVIPALYRSFKKYGSEPIPKPDNETLLDLESEEIRDLLVEIYEVYGQFSATKLRNMTHGEPPWKQAADRGIPSMISHQSMQEYFKTQLNGQAQE